ncbi:unnamed protein product, partial [marine sediment metagenome]
MLPVSRLKFFPDNAHIESSSKPKRSAVVIIEMRYMNSAFLPSFPPVNNSVAAFVAGPAIRKTNPAPGVMPFKIKDAAIGIEPVAHMYIGIEISSINGYASMGVPKYFSTIFPGIKNPIMLPIKTPTTIH